MKHKTLLTLAITLAIILILGGGILMVRRAQAQEAGPQAPLTSQGALSPQAVVSTTFTYQGRLTNSSTGNPIAGPCDFQFTLYDAASGGNTVGSTQTKSNVSLNNGYFSVELDFGATAFQGEARWIAVNVACPTGGSYTPLTGRVALNAAPYALGLRPGAVVSGTVPLGTILIARNSSSTGGGVSGQVGTQSGLFPISGAGVWGDSAGVPGVAGTSSGAAGVFGWSVSNAGVAGVSTSGNGVQGSSTSGYGVRGTTASPTGYGVYATNTAAGSGFEEPTAIYGEVNAANGFALYGRNTAGRGIAGEGSGRYGVGGFSDTAPGVFGKSTSGRGVSGESPYTGTYGVASATSGVAYGVYGQATASSSGMGVYGIGGNTGVYGDGATYGVHGYNDTGIGVYGQSTGGSSGTAVGVYGRGNWAGVYGYTDWNNAGGGVFKNMYTTASVENAVGVWAGSYYGDIIQAHELDSSGNSMNRRFRVTQVGDVYADGTYYGASGVSAGSADFAEMMRPGQAGLEPGDVLAIGPDGQMVRSTAPYQATVVGVYSTEPGFIAGNRLDENDSPLDPERIPLAVVGVVPVKVSAENGAIQPGDMLVASSIPGHAMRAGDNPPIGSVIGKALEGLRSGTGVIQMLVILQ